MRKRIEMILVIIGVVVLMLISTAITVGFGVPVTNQRMGKLLISVVIYVVSVMLVGTVIDLVGSMVVTIFYALESICRKGS